MYFNYIRLFSLCLIFFQINSFLLLSQTKNTKKADNYFRNYEYFNAIEEYKGLLKDNSVKTEKSYINFQIGECYRLINDAQKAEQWYNKAVNSKYEDHIAMLYLAQMKLRNQKYDEADTTFKNYLKTVPDNKAAKNGIASCSLAVAWTDKSSRYIVENMANINSKENEFCPVYGSNRYDVIYLSSTRPGIKGENTNPSNGQNFSCVFITSFDKKGKWSLPVPLSNSVNSIIDNCCNSFNTRTSTLYLTRGKYVKSLKPKCQIYKSKKISDEDWSSSELMSLANDSISVAHPCMTKDELVMYFSSDMQGGYGGSDIWAVTRTSKSQPWEKPMNLGPQINTPGNEMFPSYREDGKLYFSSDGIPGMGGLDIFCATKNINGNWTVHNMNYPLNSSADDYGIVFKDTTSEGLFTSNRLGGKGGDDIYSFILPEIEYLLQGSVIDEMTAKQVTDYFVSIIGSEGTDFESPSLIDGTFKIKLGPGEDYIYIVKKEGYKNHKGKMSTKGITESKTFTIEIKLTPVNIKK
jgi:peptidoglycan-associated lipoprotein